ncbi:MAG: nucleoside triphosphate pyrophosphohydrolase, partial [Calditrichota bacterium]
MCEIIRILRSPEGCPWDRKQTHHSLVTHLLEESHEVVDAIDEEDWAGLQGELGDLIMHIVFQARIGEEEKEFTIDDVLESIINKLIRRHPHVFSTTQVESAEEVLKNWELIKMKEGRESVLEGVPRSLSALNRAHRLQSRASQVGFDWEQPEDVWGKVEEEVQELREVSEAGSNDELEEEFGDLLFSLVNISRFIGVNAENALRKATNKFIRRFQAVEKEVKDQDLNMQEMTLDELDEYWEQVKRE